MVGNSPAAAARYAAARDIPSSCPATSTVTTGTAYGFGSLGTSRTVPRGPDIGGGPPTGPAALTGFAPMGVLDWWPGRSLALASSLDDHLLQPQIEPWVDNHLAEALFVGDVFGPGADRPVSRWEAMAVPAMARARHLIVGTAAKLPLEEFDGPDRVTPAAAWMQATDGQLGTGVPPALRASGCNPRGSGWPTPSTTWCSTASRCGW